MPRAYFPRKVFFIKASPPHPEGTEYVVSVEKLDGKTFAHVVKIQIAYEGRIEGRKAPSYPIGSVDFKQVVEAVHQLGELPNEKGRFVRGAEYYANEHVAPY